MTVRNQIYNEDGSNSDEYIEKIIRGTATPARDLSKPKKGRSALIEEAGSNSENSDADPFESHNPEEPKSKGPSESNRNSLMSLKPEFDYCETNRADNNNFRLEIPSAAENDFKKQTDYGQLSVCHKNDFALYLVSKVYPWRDECLGFLTYNDILKIESTSRAIRDVS
jgi:hypothetical protein